jgi:hypothetical protein
MPDGDELFGGWLETIKDFFGSLAKGWDEAGEAFLAFRKSLGIDDARDSAVKLAADAVDEKVAGLAERFAKKDKENARGKSWREAAQQMRDERDMRRELLDWEVWWEAYNRGADTAQAKTQSFLDKVRERMGDVARILGEDPFGGMLPRVQALAEKIKDPIEDAVNLMREAADVRKILGADAAKAPLAGMFQDVEGLLADNGPFAGLAEQAASKAFADLQGKVRLPEVRFAGAMQQGSREAYSLIQAWKANPQLTVEEQMKMILEEQKRLQEEQNRIGREALAAFKKLAPDAAGIGG